MLYIFGMVPGLKLLLSPDRHNPDLSEEVCLLARPFYDLLLNLGMPVQLGVLLLFFKQLVQQVALSGYWPAIFFSVSIMCEVFGVNMARALGNRVKKREQAMAKTFLVTSLYMLFFIEHNRGHHRRVSTSEDPAAAHYGESLYAFLLRSIAGSYRSAWLLENKRLQKIGYLATVFKMKCCSFS